MQTKLLIDIEDSLIIEVEKYAIAQNKSLSQIVTNYFQNLINPKKAIPSITQSLIGVLQNSEIDEQDYKKYIEDKYL